MGTNVARCAIMADDNIAYLQQAIGLLERLDDGLYTRTSPATYRSGIGGHVRHCVDHYTNFLAGRPAGRIDYDARARDPRIEQDRRVAVACLRAIITGLEELRAAGADDSVQVKMDCGDDSDPASWWSQSTVGRELQFLVSHTVHHYALIGFILKSQGFDTGPEFGLAPSTIRFNRSQTPCAR